MKLFLFYPLWTLLSFFLLPALSYGETLALSEIYGQTLPGNKNFKLDQLKKPAKGYVVTFMSATCPCSDSHMEEIKNLSEDYQDFQFLIVHSNATEPLDIASSYFKSKNISFPVLSDPKARLANIFKALKTPHTFLLNPSGEVLYKGGVSNSAKFENSKIKFLRTALSQTQNGQTPKPKQGRTLGCQIIRI